MPLEQPDLQNLNAAQGYVALGMYEDANAELEKIDRFCRALPEVLEVRLEIYRGAEKWELMQVVAKKLADCAPDEAGWIVNFAYATRRAESLASASTILINAVKRFPRVAIIHYNLACYA